MYNVHYEPGNYNLTSRISVFSHEENSLLITSSFISLAALSIKFGRSEIFHFGVIVISYF